MAQPQGSSRIQMPPFSNVLRIDVEPLEKTAHVETIDPASLDALVPELYVPTFFAYRLPENSDAVYSQTVERLKKSLSKVLVPFFMFAGRWVADPKGSFGRRLLCNDKGVPFIEAFMDAELDSVVQASTAFQPVTELQGFQFLGMEAASIMQPMQPDGVPPIFVQVTRFKCGGLVLAVTFNHMHADAEAFFNFMRAWSDVSRTNETAVKVDHNRAQVDVPALRAILPAEANAFKQAKDLDPVAMKFFKVGASTVGALKEEAKKCDGYVSTGDCIMAQLIKAFGRLQGSPLVGDKEVIVGRNVDGRERFFDPPVPNVCANAAILQFTPRVPTSELLQMPLVSIASKLREQLKTTRREEWLSPEAMGAYLQTLGSQDFEKCLISSWFSYPMYDLDFGFGNPYFSVPLNSKPGIDLLGTVYILPPIPNSVSSIATVNILAKSDVLQALESDPEFSQFFLSQ